MKQKRVSTFTTKAHLEQILKEVQKGREVLITKRGEPIAKIVPCEIPREDIGSMIDEFCDWSKNITWGEGFSIAEAKGH